MSQIKKLLEFCRQRRKQVGNMENSLSKVISALHEAQSLEDRAAKNPMLGRAVAHQMQIAKSLMQEFNNEFTRMDAAMESYCDTLETTVV